MRFLFPWLVLIATSAADPLEPCFAGKTLSQWRDLMNRIEFRDPASRRYVPGLVALMDDDEVPWITRRQAALTLGRLGPLAREAVPHVVRHLDDLDADDPEISPQRWALSSLALFGREASDAAPTLVQLLNDEQSSFIAQLGCLEALSQIGSANPQAIPALWRQLDRHLEGDGNRQLAIGAAEALGMVGPDAASSVPILMRAAQHEDENLRREAAVAIGRIGPAARVAQPLLLDLMLADDSAVVRDAAMISIGQTGPDAWPLVEPLLAVEDVEIRERAVKVIAPWRPIANRILPALEPLLKDAEPRIQLGASRSWRSLANRHDRVWPVLIELLTDSDRQIRRGASKELQAIVQTGDVTDEEFRCLLDDDRSAVQTEARRLQRLRPEP